MASEFQSKSVFDKINIASSSAREGAAKKVKGVFQFDIKNKDGSVKTWTWDLKGDGSSKEGTPTDKADIIVAIADADFVDLADGKGNAQKMFMSGKIKVKGNMMLATKLDGVLKDLLPLKAKL